MASQITRNRPTKMTLRRLLLAISLYMGGVLARSVTSARQGGILRVGGGRRCTCASGREIELGNGAVVVICGEKRHCLEAKGTRNQVVRKCLQLDVVVPSTGVVIAAGILNLVLGGGQCLLQLEEALDRPQLGVVLGDGE